MEDETNQSEKQTITIKYVDTELNGMHYARGNLGQAVWKLATGIGGIKERLADAFIEIAILQESDFPPEFRDQWKQIRFELTRGKMQFDTRVKDGQLMKVPVGRLYSTLRYMRKNKAQRIAQEICALDASLNDYLDNKDGI